MRADHVVRIPDLDPRLDGVRIAHLSDIHVGKLTPAEHVRHAVDLANQAEPDVIVMTGDYVCWRRSEIPLIEEQLSGLRARRVITTLGNHDYFTSARRVSEALLGNGYELLKNQNTAVDIGGATLSSIGIDDPVTRHHDLPAAFAGAADGARIVLCHCPEHADDIVAHGANLILSGHTHGGQIYLEGITDRIIKRMGRRYRSGFYDVAGAPLYVTTGIGFSGVTLRTGPGTAAEVAVFTLRRVETVAEAA
ncbi:MAG TPA: metallophosphoesterase [Kofleriaceae bacterium]|nr:metallophosphoesterase [Kofleriaceae bacterium]